MYHKTQELIDLLKKENIWLQKKTGQNFLVNFDALNKIVAAADIQPTDDIVEIGPGLGVLTEKLAQKAHHLRTIEFDPMLIPILKKEFAKYPNVEIIHGDALKTPLPTYPYKLVANIPYYITSPILNYYLQPEENQATDYRLKTTNAPSTTTDSPQRPKLIVLLVQKEVAEKICVRDNEHTVLSLQVQIFGKPSIVGTVGKNSFFPPPKVDSAILKIEVYPKPLINNLPLFFKLIKSTFSQRRKTLLNSLGNGFLSDRAQKAEILKQAGIAENARAQSLKLEEWQRLVDEVGKIEIT